MDIWEAEKRVEELEQVLAEIIELEAAPSNDSLGSEIDINSTSSKVLQIARAALAAERGE